MTVTSPIHEEDLHAFIDGELPANRAAEVARALQTDPALAARVAAFAADKAALAAAYRPLGRQPVPQAWITRIQQAAAAPSRRRIPTRMRWAAALAAGIVLVLGGLAVQELRAPREGSILAQAEAARQERMVARSRLTGAALADTALRDAALAQAVGLKLRAPDLAHLGWTLAELDTYPRAAAMRYRNDRGGSLTLFVRPSNGTPRFDLFEAGPVRVCIWQDEIVGAVMMGEMSAGQMMRVAGTAYAALNL